MTGLEQFIRERLTKSISDPWPKGNVEFVALLDGLIRHTGHKTFLRLRGQGTTTLLLAAAAYAADEALSPYVVLVYRDRSQARILRDALVWVAEEAGVPAERNGDQLRLYNGGCIACVSVHQSPQGQVWRYQERMVRPSLILMDLGEQAKSPTEGRILNEGVVRWSKVGGLNPAGIAVVSTKE